MSLKVSRILHAGYIFEYGESRIAFDPIFENPFSRNCHAFPSVRFDLERIRDMRFSAVFISHHHDDHCSLESLNLLNRDTPIYLYCVFEELFSMLRELGFSHVHSLEIDAPVRVGGLEIIPRRALDSDVDSMFQVSAGGMNVLNVVDSWIDLSTLEQLKSFAPWDMVLWPFQTMLEEAVIAPSRAAPASTALPPEWIEQLKVLNPKYVVPSSCQFVQEDWSWYNNALFPITYRQFESEIELNLPGSCVVRMNPGSAVVLEQGSLRDADSLPWVIAIGEQNVDYRFFENSVAPPTSEIAKRFAPLEPEQAVTVRDYCRRGLIETYRSLDPFGDPYFEKSRIWRLAVYDHEGGSESFHYRVQSGSIELVTDFEEPLAWLTEVPASKLYAALETGESLTSMYVRINDFKFSESIEDEIGSADILEDPLVRCLFTGAFGSYQREQLKRLKS